MARIWRLRGIGSFQREQRGTATIEFVVTLPLFMAALAFAFEFGQFFIAYQQTASNVRAAARYLSRIEWTDIASENLAENIIRTGRPNGTPADAPAYLRNLCYPDGNIPADCIIRGDTPVRIEVRVNFPLTIFKFIDPSSSNGATLPFRIVEYIQPVGS